MNYHIHACISYIVCRLITGRRISAIYELSDSREVDIAGLPDFMFLREFEEKHRDYVPGYADGCSYRYTSASGHTLEIFISEKTFIVHVEGSSAYFIGNIRGNNIYLYDHMKSLHVQYRLAVCGIDSLQRL